MTAEEKKAEQYIRRCVRDGQRVDLNDPNLAALGSLPERQKFFIRIHQQVVTARVIRSAY